jgi:phosphate transport system ATP-binding protein
VLFHGKNIYDPDVDPVEVRRRIGMVFQKPNPFPKSIYENIAWGAKINGFKGEHGRNWSRIAACSGAVGRSQGQAQAERLLLSGGQQQRLCIARAIAIKPRSS